MLPNNDDYFLILLSFGWGLVTVNDISLPLDSPAPKFLLPTLCLKSDNQLFLHQVSFLFFLVGGWWLQLNKKK